MLLRKTTISPAARRHFGLFRDPFSDDVQSAEDVYATPDIRYVREALWQTARHGGFLAVVGESGSGKTTLRRDLNDRLAREGVSTIVIEPYVLGMEDSDATGRTLKASAIADAIISAVAPLEPVRRTQDAKYRQLHRVLRDSRRAGHTHLLVIEEAHGLPIPTLKHLKRFWELEDGFKKLLGIALIGQPELRLKLSERNHAVREVVQRCELVELLPLDAHLEGYLRHKFNRVGTDLGKVVAPGAIEALRDKLTFAPRPQAGQRAETVSLLYPLAVANLLAAAMNLAAELGAPTVTADIVKEA
jgi:type II secretory pathway predicted ATPase ExeA